MFSSDAYLYGRCIPFVTSETSRVTSENMSSMEIGFFRFRSSAFVNGLCSPSPSKATDPASVA